MNRALVRVERRLVAHESLSENHSRIYIYYFSFFLYFRIFCHPSVRRPTVSRRSASSSTNSLSLSLPLTLSFYYHSLVLSLARARITNHRFNHSPTISRFTLAPVFPLLRFTPPCHPPLLVRTDDAIRRDLVCRYRIDPLENKLLMLIY